MSIQVKSGFCKACDAQRKVERKGTNHILHLLISVFTAGLWIPVWFLHTIKIGGWRCGTCGSTKTSGVR